MSEKVKKVSGKTLYPYLQYHNAMPTYKDFVAIDIETTGLENFEVFKIMQLSAVRFRDNQEVDSIDYLINPQDDITLKAQELTGLTASMLSFCPIIDEVLPSFLEFLGNDVLVAQNALFDMRFLLFNMFELNIPHKEFYVVDTLEFARNYILKEDGKPIDSYRLEDLVRHLQLDDNRNFRSHDALEDSRMAGRLYIKCNEIAKRKVQEEMEVLDYVNKKVNQKNRDYILHNLINVINNVKNKKFNN